MAATNFTVDQRDTFKLTFTWKAGGKPVDLTGFGFLFRAAPTGNQAINVSTDTGHIVINDAKKGAVTLIIPKEETALFAWTTTDYTLRAIFPDGATKKLLYGKLKLVRSV